MPDRTTCPVVRDHAVRLRLTHPAFRSQRDVRHFHFNLITRDAQRALSDAILQQMPLPSPHPETERG